MIALATSKVGHDGVVPFRRDSQRARPRARVLEPSARTDADTLLVHVARGDTDAFAQLYDLVAPQVYGVVRRVLRDPSRSEEVAQEVLVEVWRTATRFDPAVGKATTWILTIAHRRAVDRVRSSQSSRDREQRVAAREQARDTDTTFETVQINFEQQQVRQALAGLTDLQREAIELAYYGGNTHREVAQLLDAPLGTVKTRLRDGLIRLRDMLGVEA